MDATSADACAGVSSGHGARRVSPRTTAQSLPPAHPRTHVPKGTGAPLTSGESRHASGAGGGSVAGGMAGADGAPTQQVAVAQPAVRHDATTEPAADATAASAATAAAAEDADGGYWLGPRPDEAVVRATAGGAGVQVVGAEGEGKEEQQQLQEQEQPQWETASTGQHPPGALPSNTVHAESSIVSVASSTVSTNEAAAALVREEGWATSASEPGRPDRFRYNHSGLLVPPNKRLWTTRRFALWTPEPKHNESNITFVDDERLMPSYIQAQQVGVLCVWCGVLLLVWAG